MSKKGPGRPTEDKHGRPKKQRTFRLSPEIVEFIEATWSHGDRTARIEDTIRKCKQFKEWMRGKR
jgi:hypothetical protein